MSPKPLGVHDLITPTIKSTLPTLIWSLIELNGVETARQTEESATVSGTYNYFLFSGKEKLTLWVKKLQGRKPRFGVEIAIRVVAILDDAPYEFLSGKGIGCSLAPALHHGGLKNTGGTGNHWRISLRGLAVVGTEEGREIRVVDVKSFPGFKFHVAAKSNHARECFFLSHCWARPYREWTMGLNCPVSLSTKSKNA